MIHWTAADVERAGIVEPAEWLLWLRRGLIDWRNPAEKWRAFAPIDDCFDPGDDAEPQLSLMFQAMSEHWRQTFIAAIELGLRDAEPEPSGYALFDALQRLVRLINRSEPIRTMIDRVCSPGFLEYATPDIAQHLFAGCIATAREVGRSPMFAEDAVRLIASPYYDAAYAPYVLESLNALRSQELFDNIALLQPDLASTAETSRTIQALTAGAEQLSEVDFVRAIGSQAYVRVMADVRLAGAVYQASLRPTVGILEAFARVADTPEGHQPSMSDQTINDLFVGLDKQSRAPFRRAIAWVRRAMSLSFKAELEEEQGLARIAGYAIERRKKLDPCGSLAGL